MSTPDGQELLATKQGTVPLENTRKRRRITNQESPFPSNDDRQNWLDLQSHPPFLLPADPLRSFADGGWDADGFSPDPGFLASQEELRCKLFSLAYSAVPTGATSPGDLHLGPAGDAASFSASQPHRVYRESLRSCKRIEYLKNYIAEVAPWVSRWLACVIMVNLVF